MEKTNKESNIPCNIVIVATYILLILSTFNMIITKLLFGNEPRYNDASPIYWIFLYVWFILAFCFEALLWIISIVTTVISVKKKYKLKRNIIMHLTLIITTTLQIILVQAIQYIEWFPGCK